MLLDLTTMIDYNKRKIRLFDLGGLGERVIKFPDHLAIVTSIEMSGYNLTINPYQPTGKGQRP